ncbi:MAG: cytochrome c biogenesis protein ResB [Prevotella sp.]|nr:cytochrome c biogenesis protein ResB [Prevotella sp.]
MWRHPWGMREGLAIGAGLILVGEMLQLSVGSIDWSLFAFPVNAIVLGILLVGLFAIYYLGKRVYAFRWMRTTAAAVPCLFYVSLLTVVMGLTGQVEATSQPTDLIGLSKMLSFWPFVLTYLWMTTIVGLVCVSQGIRLFSPRDTNLRRLLPSFVSHLGLFIVLTAGTLGSSDMRRLMMFTNVGEPEWRAINERMEIEELPLTIQLEQFIMEEWQGEGIDPHTPKRFASKVQVLTIDGDNIHATIEVNKPLTIDGWKIYQFSYDTSKGAQSQMSIFELVTDPWMPFVYVGIYLMLAGAVLVFVTAQRKKDNEP